MDHSSQKLNSLIREDKSDDDDHILVWLDDNYSAGDIQFDSVKDKAVIISNRVDTIAELEALGLNVHFSDFSVPPGLRKFKSIYYRVSKERFVSHRCINKSVSLLKKKGTLFLVGRKEDGIKTYFDKCIKILKLDGKIKKHRDCYIATLFIDDERPKKLLDDGDYKTLRPSFKVNVRKQSFSVYTKPGVYGWKKADAGTKYLIDTISPLIDEVSADENALDLGCGSGHLTLALSAFGYKDITATDNSATAIIAVKRTLQENKVKATIISDDAGKTLSEKFDLIVSNPPFHKGFETDKTLTNKFVHACRRLLKPHGVAYLVTNAFIGIEKEVFNAGLSGKVVDSNRQFKVIKIKHR